MRCIHTALRRCACRCLVRSAAAAPVILPLMGHDLCVEVKARADGFRELYGWLDGRDVLVVKADRREPLVVVRLSQRPRLPKAGPHRCKVVE